MATTAAKLFVLTFAGDRDKGAEYEQSAIVSYKFFISLFQRSYFLCDLWNAEQKVSTCQPTE